MICTDIYICNNQQSQQHSFKFWVGMMISKQPFFFLGLEDVNQCKSNAFGAMWVFLISFGASIAYLIFESAIENKRRRQLEYSHEQEQEDHPMLPRGMSDYIVNTEVELSDMSTLNLNVREIS
jgi:hypothetical protein